MKRVNLLTVWVLLFVVSSSILAQYNFERKVVKVPKVAPTAIKIDGVMDEAAWGKAAKANIITNTGYEVYTNQYYRSDLKEPDYDEIYARMLWAKDTLYVFVHIDEVVNDSSNLFWKGKWSADQLFVSISNRLGLDIHPAGRWNGNVFTVPDGPYHFLILGDKITLNNGERAGVPLEWRKSPADSFRTGADLDATKFARMAAKIDTVKGTWDIELAIYNPGINAQSKIGFNIGGSQGSRYFYNKNRDGYSYWTWQPNVPDKPYEEPAIGAVLKSIAGYYDPGLTNLVTTACHAILEFVGDNEVYVRKEVEVPKVAPTAIKIDGVMNEAAWGKAAKANIITNTGYEVYTNQYYRSDLKEPDYDEIYARMLWAKDTLYVFVHIDEVVNDSSNLFWKGKWSADQLFVSISNRLGLDIHPAGRWNGNVFTVPDGPYHFLILGDKITLNNGERAGVPLEWRKSPADSFRTGADLDATKFARMAAKIDTVKGTWDIELAIYNPGINAQSKIGFNIGGSQGSRYFYNKNRDGYSYWTWQPNVPDKPYEEPAIGAVLKSIAGYYDPGLTNLVTTRCHAVLNFVNEIRTNIENSDIADGIPVKFGMDQNYPNPFNPSTTIRFHVNKAASVTLKIYNTLGQEVTTLVNNQVLSTGSHLVTWNAQSLSSGVYFYRLEAEGFVQTKKMVLIK